MENCQWFLLYFRMDSSFLIIERNFIKFPIDDMVGWNTEAWLSSSHQMYEVTAETEDGNYDGVVVQIAAQAADLYETMAKAKVFRYEKKLQITKLLGYFSRVKMGRQRNIPAFNSVFTESELSESSAPMNVGSSRKIARAPPRKIVPPPFMPPLPPSPSVSMSSLIERSDLQASTPTASNSASSGSGLLPVNSRLRNTAGRFAPEVQPYIDCLSAQGIEFCSVEGNSRLMLLLLTEVVKLKYMVATALKGGVLSKDSAEAEMAVVCNTSLGLPLESKTAYSDFVNSFKTDKMFKTNVVSLITFQ